MSIKKETWVYCTIQSELLKNPALLINQLQILQGCEQTIGGHRCRMPMLFTVCGNPHIHTKCAGQKMFLYFVSAPLSGSQRVKQKTCQWLQHFSSQVCMSRPARSWHSSPLACPQTMFVCASYLTVTHSHVNFIGGNDFLQPHFVVYL